MNNLIISFICPDRSGIVQNLSNIIKQHQGNWQTSSLHHLSGFFTGVIETSVNTEHTNSLCQALMAIPEFKCHIESAGPMADEDNVANAPIVLELTANDRSGIIQEISAVIHHQGGNLLNLETQQASAAHSGQCLFSAKASISVDENAISNLVSGLEALADDLIVEISR
jgi:glycine cleavage system regulatory protein